MESTYHNIQQWYDALKAFLIDKGFATERPEEEWLEHGELMFVDGQAGRIANLDESALPLDNTTNSKGGRPAGGYYDARIAAGATNSAHKSSFCVTLVAGCFTEEAFPLHFQLPSDAREENQGFGAEFIEDMLETHATYLFRERKPFSCTYGVNEKGGMDKQQFGEYLFKNFVPLVETDCADIPGKRVLLLVDGGPGRTNATMLAALRTRGIYLFPSGPPSTTHILQIMDMLFGEFKRVYSSNIETLYEYRLSHPTSSTITTKNDIGVLVFGSQHSRKRNEDPSFPLLQNAAEAAFNGSRIHHCWSNKLGVFPMFTRAALKNKNT